jgi:predicted  nucleic acid-binding Zn-ribbon protein
MTNQKDDLVCEIQDLQNEIDEHTRKINQLKTALERKEQQLNEIPITLERIIIECMIAHNGEVRLEILENILDRVEVEMFPKQFQSYSSYIEGWNDCVVELKTRLRE